MPLEQRGNLLIFVPCKATTYTAHCKLLVWMVGCVLYEYYHIPVYLVKRERAKKSIFCNDSITVSLLSVALTIHCTEMLHGTQCSPFPMSPCLV